jgi:DeoR/GlpR family transcriptional regulator of sugar metabolism
VILDVGTTVLELARRLRRHSNLTVLVTNLQAANELAPHASIRLIVAGGVVRFPELSLAGPQTEQMLEEFHFDKAFLGASGITMDGITGFNLEDAHVKRVIIQRARQRILLVDHAKFGHVAFCRVAPISCIETVVTGQETDPDIVKGLEDRGVSVLRA